jgi:hypothetical protein
MSSERNGLGDDEANAGDVPQEDSWFEPASPGAGGAVASANGFLAAGVAAEGLADGADSTGGSRATEWFLRTGRAGLLPDSVAISSNDETAPEWRHEAAGAPPWASEGVQADGEPPPWESGPWPGPGEERPRQTYTARDRQARAPGAGSARGQGDTGRNWQARAALATGVLPLVVPGIVLGVLGLRQARFSRSGGIASSLGIGLSVVWAVILGVVVFGSAGSTSGGCTVPSAVRVSYAQVNRDLSAVSSGVSSGTLVADARLAAGQANTAAANARDVSLRGALAALARDLEQVQAEVPASDTATVVRRLPGSTRLQLQALRVKLHSDETALSGSCTG